MVERIKLSVSPLPVRRRVLSVKPEPEPEPEVYGRKFRPRHPLAGIKPLPREQWPDRVYGYHPLHPEATVICIQRDIPGYYEVSPEINPYQRNRELGIEQEVAEAVIRAAWASRGHAWK